MLFLFFVFFLVTFAFLADGCVSPLKLLRSTARMMSFVDDRRSYDKKLKSVLFGVAGGAAAGCGLVLTGAGLGVVAPMTAFYTFQVPLFETFLHSEGAAKLRQSEFDPVKWGGAIGASLVGGAAALGVGRAYFASLGCSALKSTFFLGAAGGCGITNYSHVANTADFIRGGNKSDKIVVDAIAIGTSSLANMAFLRYMQPSLSRPVALCRGAVLVAVPFAVIDALEKLCG